ncbi:membrane protein insertase YidC [Striga asiatica]|uniref:Membrane protein insertase YidC n=1 Tax=Striga asiatica TaxID=4170 RepID=A0A5A7PB94_STRAF|nr:membrane protein insertase YidC [Striga asiatica]
MAEAETDTAGRTCHAKTKGKKDGGRKVKAKAEPNTARRCTTTPDGAADPAPLPAMPPKAKGESPRMERSRRDANRPSSVLPLLGSFWLASARRLVSSACARFVLARFGGGGDSSHPPLPCA